MSHLSVRDLVDALQRWLPNPEYRFVGGPLDGKTQVVEMIETPNGVFPPGMIAYHELPQLILPRRFDAVVVDVTVTRHLYRFVPGLHVNEGHYELIAEKEGPPCGS